MKTSKDVIIRRDGILSWNFHSIQNCPLVFERLNCVLKTTVHLNQSGGGSFRTEKLNEIMDKEDRLSEAMKHYRP